MRVSLIVVLIQLSLIGKCMFGILSVYYCTENEIIVFLCLLTKCLTLCHIGKPLAKLT